MVRCADGTFYIGYTTEVQRRVSEHNEGAGATYTRGRTPVELVYAEPQPSRSAGLAREAELKSLDRREKRRLADGVDPTD